HPPVQQTTGRYEATTLPGSQQMDLGSIALKNVDLCRFDTSCPRGMSNDMPRVPQCGTNGRSRWRKNYAKRNAPSLQICKRTTTIIGSGLDCRSAGSDMRKKLSATHFGRVVITIGVR